MKNRSKKHIRGKEIKIADKTDRNEKIHHVDAHTRMLGTEPRVFRIASPGQGLPKWKKK